MEEVLEQIAQTTSCRSCLGVLKVPLALELILQYKREKLHVIQHLLAKIYMYILIIFIFHLQFGSVYTFQGIFNPVSSCSIVQCRILPILLYGVENWIMSCESIKKLECFQGEIAMRILQMPQWYSNKVACIVLNWVEFHPFIMHHQEVEISALN